MKSVTAGTIASVSPGRVILRPLAGGDINFRIQAIVAVDVFIDPISRGIDLRQLTASEPERRGEYIRKVTITVAITLFGAALVDKQLLDLMGIDLGAFGVAGGLLVATIGIQLMLGGVVRFFGLS
jgi:multiple antibiotic resistance protein